MARNEPLKRTDLSHDLPTSKAVAQAEEARRIVAEAVARDEKILEDLLLSAQRGKNEAKVRGKTVVGSALNLTQATCLLVAASCLITVVAWAIGVPAVTALIVGLGATAGFYLLTKVTCPRTKR